MLTMLTAIFTGADRDKRGIKEKGANPEAAKQTGDLAGGGEKGSSHQHHGRREGPPYRGQVRRPH